MFTLLQANNEPLTRVGDLASACEHDRAPGAEARTYFPEVDAYRGAAPHPIGTFRIEDGSVGGVEWVEPDGAYGPYAVYAMEDPKRIQLIACLGEAIVGPGGYLDHCQFRSGSGERIELDLNRGEYDAVLYEAKTGKKIAEAHVVGSEDADCPSGYSYTEGNAGSLHTKPDAEALDAAFGSYVDASR